MDVNDVSFQTRLPENHSVSTNWGLPFLFKENVIPYSCCTIFNATFLLCSQRAFLGGIFCKMFVIVYKKNVLCLALWLFLHSEPKWIYENVTCSTLLYSFNEKFFPIYVRQCLSELISHYVKEKTTWLILKELFDT